MALKADTAQTWRHSFGIEYLNKQLYLCV